LEREKGTWLIGLVTSHSRTSIHLMLPFSFSSRSVSSALTYLTCSYSIGNRYIYGRRAPRCNIARRRPHRYGPVQLNMQCRPGMLIVCYYTATFTIDIPSRHTCIFSLETRVWNAPTTRVQYGLSSVLRSKCNTTQVDRSTLFHW